MPSGVQADETAIEGEIKRMRRFDSGYTVLTVGIGKGREMTLVGEMQPLTEGMNIRANVTSVNHPKYGQQYKVIDIEEKGFGSKDALITYLCSESFYGIGQHYASKIVEAFGLETLDIIDKSPDKLYEVPGLTRAKAENLITAWQEARGHHRTMSHLVGLGLTLNQATKAHKHFNDNVLSVIQNNYYRLTEIHGIGFETADKIALENGVARDASIRIYAAIEYALDDALRSGHCFLLLHEVNDATVKLLNSDANNLQVSEALRNLEAAGKIDKEADRIYLPGIRMAERSVAEKLAEMLQYDNATPLYDNIEDLRTDMQKWDIAQNITLAPEQEQAIFNAVTSRVAIITGGPGCGKTTITKAVCEILEHHGIEYKLCSPTGRAAKRLQEATGRDASTIHRLLGSKGALGFTYNEEFPLETGCVIVDETSMVDLPLMHNLLSAMENDDRLIMVGDADQLPSVGPGNVLRDLISSGMIPTERLQRIFRQDAGSSIVVTAHQVLHGEVPELPTPKESKGRNCMFVSVDEVMTAQDYIVALVTKSLPSLGFTSDQIQVLTPMRGKGLGVTDLNPRLQEVLNPPKPGLDEAQTLGRIFRVGDRVMQTRNVYEKNVFNGDVGQVAAIVKGDKTVITVDFPDNGLVEYQTHEWDELLHSYASTIHRAQGSEYPAVILVAHRCQYHMLARNLFYTGLTRAKKVCIVVGTQSAMERSVTNNKEVLRNTTLSPVLKNYLRQ